MLALESFTCGKCLIWERKSIVITFALWSCLEDLQVQEGILEFPFQLRMS